LRLPAGGWWMVERANKMGGDEGRVSKRLQASPGLWSQINNDRRTLQVGLDFEIGKEFQYCTSAILTPFLLSELVLFY